MSETIEFETQVTKDDCNYIYDHYFPFKFINKIFFVYINAICLKDYLYFISNELWSLFFGKLFVINILTVITFRIIRVFVYIKYKKNGLCTITNKKITLPNKRSFNISECIISNNFLFIKFPAVFPKHKVLVIKHPYKPQELLQYFTEQNIPCKILKRNFSIIKYVYLNKI